MRQPGESEQPVIRPTVGSAVRIRHLPHCGNLGKPIRNGLHCLPFRYPVRRRVQTAPEKYGVSRVRLRSIVTIADINFVRGLNAL